MFIDITELSNDRAFNKAKTVAKLEKQGKTFEFISFLRQYVESISKIHIKLRELLKSDTENWEQFLYEAIESYNNFSKNQKNFVIIDKIETKQNEQGNVESVGIVESVDIFDEFIKYRKILEDKNKRIYTSSNYISSESPKIS